MRRCCTKRVSGTSPLCSANCSGQHEIDGSQLIWLGGRKCGALPRACRAKTYGSCEKQDPGHRRTIPRRTRSLRQKGRLRESEKCAPRVSSQRRGYFLSRKNKSNPRYRPVANLNGRTNTLENPSARFPARQNFRGLWRAALTGSRVDSIPHYQPPMWCL